MYTGDDFNFAALIGGDANGYPTRCSASSTRSRRRRRLRLPRFAGGDRARFDAILAPTVPLSRKIFEAPTRFYKTGIVLMAYLNGHQSHFTMVGGQQSARSLVHLADVFRLADQAACFVDPERAAARMRLITALHGCEHAGSCATVDQHRDAAGAVEPRRDRRRARPPRHSRISRGATRSPARPG
jgi:hypothetical protein